MAASHYPNTTYGRQTCCVTKLNINSNNALTYEAALLYKKTAICSLLVTVQMT